MQEHDGLPQAQIFRFVKFLIAKLGITKETYVQDRGGGQSDDETGCVWLPLFDRGEVVFEEKSTSILERREQVPALYTMPKWKLKHVKSH